MAAPIRAPARGSRAFIETKCVSRKRPHWPNRRAPTPATATTPSPAGACFCRSRSLRVLRLCRRRTVVRLSTGAVLTLVDEAMVDWLGYLNVPTDICGGVVSANGEEEPVRRGARGDGEEARQGEAGQGVRATPPSISRFRHRGRRRARGSARSSDLRRDAPATDDPGQCLRNGSHRRFLRCRQARRSDEGRSPRAASRVGDEARRTRSPPRRRSSGHAFLTSDAYLQFPPPDAHWRTLEGRELWRRAQILARFDDTGAPPKTEGEALEALTKYMDAWCANPEERGAGYSQEVSLAFDLAIRHGATDRVAR